MKKLIDIITAFQNLGFITNTHKESVLFVYCDKKAMRHDFRVIERYAGLVQLILEACGYEARWDNDEVCALRDNTSKIVPVVIKEYYATHEHIEFSTSDKLLDYVRNVKRFTVWKVIDEPLVDLS